MPLDYNACTTTKTDKMIVVKENQSRFELINALKKSINVVEVDGCLINSSKVLKCDYLFYKDLPSRKVLYVELKGCDIEHAIKQLESTVLRTRPRFNTYKKLCYAVTSRIPKAGPRIQKLKIKFYKDNKIPLFVKNNILSIVLEKC